MSKLSSCNIYGCISTHPLDVVIIYYYKISIFYFYGINETLRLKKARHYQYVTSECLVQKQVSRLQHEELAFGQKGENVGKSMTTFQEEPNNNKSLLETMPYHAAPPHVNVVRPSNQGSLITASLL